MRVGNFLIVGSAIFAVLTAVACTKRVVNEVGDDDDDDGGSQTSAKSTTTANQADTCLGKAHLAFDKASCTTCMSDNADCCQATITCFNTDKECSALQACMLACNGGGTASPTPTSGGTPTSTFATVYSDLQPSCGSCHLNGTSGAPIFFGADVNATYALFKQNNFQASGSALVLKGAHEGPALTDAQKTDVTAWQAAEATAPATGPGSGTGTGGGNGTGGGGGNGTGGGGGNGTGGGTGAGAGDGGADALVQCQATCKSQHAAGLPDWQAYNNCSTVLCKSDCL